MHPPSVGRSNHGGLKSGSYIKETEDWTSSSTGLRPNSALESPDLQGESEISPSGIARERSGVGMAEKHVHLLCRTCFGTPPNATGGCAGSIPHRSGEARAQ